MTELDDTAAPVDTATADDPVADNPAAGKAPADKAPPVDKPQSDWADDWRQKLAAGDDKFLKRLERFQSPVDVAKSWRALEQKMSSGEVKNALPEKPTEEQLGAWRKENGIPDKPEGYLEKLPDGLVIGADDKDVVAAFIAEAHAVNASPAFVGKALDWYYKTAEAQIAAQADADKAARQDMEDTLRPEWGNEFRGNMNARDNFLDTMPPMPDGTPLKSALLNARMEDGTRLGDSAPVVKWLVRLANDANPAGFVAPGVGLSQVDSINDEIKSIEGKMRTNRTAYDKDEKMQARYRQLLDARQKLGAK